MLREEPTQRFESHVPAFPVCSPAIAASCHRRQQRGKGESRLLIRECLVSASEQSSLHGFVMWRFEGEKIAERWATVTPPAEGTAWTAAGR
jgi:hypothetical protein